MALSDLLTRGPVIRAVVLLVLSVLAIASHPARADVVRGPAQDVAVIDEFSATTAGAWQARSGPNVRTEIETGQQLPGVAPSLTRLFVGRVDPADKEPGHNWFTYARADLPADLVPPDIDGFRVLLGSQSVTTWWISFELTTEGGTTYAAVIANGTYPGGRIVEHLVALDDLRSGDGTALSPEQARTVRTIRFVTSSPDAALYLDRITAYRRERYTAWLDFATSHPTNNLFQRTDPVFATFTVGGTSPVEAAGFRYEVRDFHDTVAAQGSVPLIQNESSYTIDLTPARHGYYEVRAYWTDEAGRDLVERSCIRGEGTMPHGLGTFSVLPATVEENRALSRRLGTDAFFGLHGDFHGLADAIGLTWRFGYTGWQWLEPQEPDRSDGPAAWARDAIASEPAEPVERPHILPFRGNFALEAPPWARRDPNVPPGFDWDHYLAMVRDSVRVEKHRYPHMSPRIYGCAWELNLNMPPYVSQQPPYTPAEAVELFRRTRATIRAEDPDAMVIGPCPSMLDLAWFEAMFQAGVLEQIDGIETHAYNDGSLTPEENDFPGKLARLRELIRQYDGGAGRSLPIYVTERGEHGAFGAEIADVAQAQWMTRSAIILKGEGVRVFLPFYGIDYDRSEYWGFCYNLEVDQPPSPWATKRISPKPVVNTMAACVQVLEGAAPKRRIEGLGPDVWAYEFEKDNSTIIAIWSAGAPTTINWPVNAGNEIHRLDIMGHPAPAPVTNGAVHLPLDGSPTYLIHTTRRP